MKTIYIASDHAGYEYKTKLIEDLISKGYKCVDCGTNSVESVDYPIFAKKVCNNILNDIESFGILICGTGIGMSIQANRFKGIRATVCWNRDTVLLARQHNNANVLCLGARMLSYDDVFEFSQLFLNENFLGGKHKRRIDEIDG